MDQHVFVGVYPDESAGRAVAAGVVTFAGDQAWFEYNPAYAAAIKAGALPVLDPRNHADPTAPIPLPGAAHPGVFGDSAPDHWGQTVIRRLMGLATLTPVERLACSGEDRIGALAFRHREIAPNLLPACTTQALGRYRAFAESFRDGWSPLASDGVRDIALAGSSAGGARPKCSFRDEDGVFWLAKFARPDDPVSVPAIEHAATRLGALCGLSVCETRLGPDPRPAIMVRRFDRLATGGRRMFASLQSLLGAARMTDSSYPDMALALRDVSAAPEQDARELFRRMAFNVMCGNTDDHLKNHGMVRLGGAWRLSPAYDITPQVMGDALHSVALGRFGAMPGVDNLLSRHGAFLFGLTEARQVLADMADRTAGWREAFRDFGVSDDDIAVVEAGECFGRHGRAIG